MLRRTLVAAALAAACSLTIVARAGADPAAPPDLTGRWRLDPKHSDAMPQPGADSGERGGRGVGWGGGGGGRRHGGGGGSGEGGTRGGAGERGVGDRPAGARPVRYPDLMHVTQTATIVSIEDSTGAMLQEITTLGGAKDTLIHAPGAQVAEGAWKEGVLAVERQSPRGKITQTISLGDKGGSLVVLTHIDLGGDNPPREFKRVYQRVVETN